jgi:hypothetical protein
MPTKGQINPYIDDTFFKSLSVKELLDEDLFCICGHPIDLHRSGISAGQDDYIFIGLYQYFISYFIAPIEELYNNEEPNTSHRISPRDSASESRKQARLRMATLIANTLLDSPNNAKFLDIKDIKNGKSSLFFICKDWYRLRDIIEQNPSLNTLNKEMALLRLDYRLKIIRSYYDKSVGDSESLERELKAKINHLSKFTYK